MGELPQLPTHRHQLTAVDPVLGPAANLVVDGGGPRHHAGAIGEQRRGPWDRAPGAIPVCEAGGRAGTFDGSDRKPGDGEPVASNGAIHDRLFRSFAQARAGAGLPARPIAA